MMNKLLVAFALMVVGTAAFGAIGNGGTNDVPEPGTLALVALAVVAVWLPAAARSKHPAAFRAPAAEPARLRFPAPCREPHTNKPTGDQT